MKTFALLSLLGAISATTTLANTSTRSVEVSEALSKLDMEAL